MTRVFQKAIFNIISVCRLAGSYSLVDVGMSKKVVCPNCRKVISHENVAKHRRVCKLTFTVQTQKSDETITCAACWRTFTGKYNFRRLVRDRCPAPSDIR